MTATVQEPRPIWDHAAISPQARLLRAQIELAGVQQAEVATQAGYTRKLLNDYLTSDRPITPRTADRITRAIAELEIERLSRP